MAAPVCRARSTARCSIVPPKPFSARKPGTMTSTSAWATPRIGCSCPTLLVDHVNEGNVGIYAQNTTRWTDWFRTTAGWRGDYFWASVNSILQPANSGNPKTAIGSPKFTMTFGPFYKTELFLAAGMGYHSNDARGVTATQVPGDPATAQDSTPFLVRSRGAEIGVRTKAIPNLGQLHQPFLPAPKLRAVLRRRYRHHRSGTAKSAHRHRDHQQLPACLVDEG